MPERKVDLSESAYLKFAQTRRAEEIAHMFGCTVSTLLAYIKRRGWPTPRDIRRDYRLRTIQQLLSEGVSSKQIQNSLGLSSQRYSQLCLELKENPPATKEPTKPARAKTRDGAEGEGQFNFGLRRSYYQVLQGIWNPRENNHSWVVFDDGLSLKQAREAVDETIASFLRLGRLQRVTSEHRKAYAGPPFAIVEMTSKIVERIGNTIRSDAVFADSRFGYDGADEAEAHPS